VKGA
jgi:hypothetical protein